MKYNYLLHEMDFCRRMPIKFALFASLLIGVAVATDVTIDLASRGRQFLGIGAISGGGGHTRMLPLYPEPQRSEILDYLFKPRFGASLHIFKVEVGGDDQTTQGTESSHRHYPWEHQGNFNRGYQFWMINEAKKRNPNIKLSALPWSFPGWLSNGKNPFVPFDDVNRTAEYIVSYILGIKREFGHHIDEIGIWNEKPEYVPYIKALYYALKANGLEKKTQIAAGDNHWEIIDDIVTDPELASMIGKIAVHYPGEFSPPKAKPLSIPLTSSEDDSTDLWTTKTGCLARILNRNYVTGLFTSTIIYNAIAAHYDNLNFPRCGLLYANQPWHGWYNVENPVWIVAHTTQFTNVGWWYLAHGKGVGKFSNEGGSYVTYVSPDGQFFTIVIETVDYCSSGCVRPPIPPYPTATNDTLVFTLKNWKFSTTPKLYVRVSDLKTGEMFVAKDAIIVGQDMKFSVNIAPNQVITLSNVSPGNKGHFRESKIPERQDFPMPYEDDFESTPLDQEGRYIQQQQGVFEVVESNDAGHGHVLQQMLLQSPVTWCIPNMRPLAVLGHYNLSDYFFSADIKIPPTNGSSGAFIAGRVQHGGCSALITPGVFVWVSPQDDAIYIAERMTEIRRPSSECKAEYKFSELPNGGINAWFNLKMNLVVGYVSVWINEIKIIDKCSLERAAGTLSEGFLGIGTRDHGLAWFDNLKVGQPIDEGRL